MLLSSVDLFWQRTSPPWDVGTSAPPPPCRLQEPGLPSQLMSLTPFQDLPPNTATWVQVSHGRWSASQAQPSRTAIVAARHGPTRASQGPAQAAMPPGAPQRPGTAVVTAKRRKIAKAFFVALAVLMVTAKLVAPSLVGIPPGCFSVAKSADRCVSTSGTGCPPTTAAAKPACLPGLPAKPLRLPPPCTKQGDELWGLVMLRTGTVADKLLELTIWTTPELRRTIALCLCLLRLLARRLADAGWVIVGYADGYSHGYACYRRLVSTVLTDLQTRLQEVSEEKAALTSQENSRQAALTSLAVTYLDPYLCSLLVVGLGGGIGSLSVQLYLNKYGNDATRNRVLLWDSFVFGALLACASAGALEGVILKDVLTHSPDSIRFLPLLWTGARLGAVPFHMLHHRL